MTIDVAVFEALEEVFGYYDTYNAWSFMIAMRHAVEAFSNDYREWKAVNALSAITLRGSGELFSLVFDDAKHEEMSKRLLEKDIHWNIVGSRIKVCCILHLCSAFRS
jgi:hypothetical protein